MRCLTFPGAAACRRAESSGPASRAIVGAERLAWGGLGDERPGDSTPGRPLSCVFSPSKHHRDVVAGGDAVAVGEEGEARWRAAVAASALLACARTPEAT